LSRERAGVSVGGPVQIPKLYNGKDKTFFFGTYEGFRFPRAQTIQDEVPTQALRNGDFSGTGTIINDPTTGKPLWDRTVKPGPWSRAADLRRLQRLHHGRRQRRS